MSESLTQKWLRQNISLYQHPERVFSDIDGTLARFPSLRPKSDVYTYDDGRTLLLLCVHGLLPISYRNAAYNIPVAIWIPRQYPSEPPITLVVPTKDMLIKASKYIQVSGRAHIEYIQNWEKKHDGCHLSSLIDALQDQFSRDPPVYAKPKPLQPVPIQPHVASSSYAERPPPPIPSSHPSPSISSPPPLQDTRPILPPKPGNPSLPVTPIVRGTPIVPPPQSHPYASVPTSPPQYNASQPPPPPPPPPIYRPDNVSQSQSRLISPSSSGTTPSLPLDPRLRPAPQVPITPSPPHPPHNYPPPQLPSQPPLASPPPHTPIPNLLEEDSSPQITPLQFAPAPPRPPNPELLRLHASLHQKFTAELASLEQLMTVDSERLRTHQTNLLAGEPAIRDEMARLEAVRDVCRNVAGRMRTVVDAAERNVAELKRKGDPEVDELVCSTSIVHNQLSREWQLINLVAEDNAIEDTIYHLHRALNTGRIDLERFLRSTRALAEEQFMKRALIDKIHSGLPMGSMSMGSPWT